MTRSSSSTIAVLAAAVLALTGCTGSTAPHPASSEASSTETATTAAPATDGPAAEPGGAGTLVGTVGTDADPDAFVIALTDENGEPVASLPAGDYTLTILDPSGIHNFRLSGEGVDVASEVGAMEELELEITLSAGTYEFVCDPHVGSMRGELEVTG